MFMSVGARRNLFNYELDVIRFARGHFIPPGGSISRGVIKKLFSVYFCACI